MPPSKNSIENGFDDPCKETEDGAKHARNHAEHRSENSYDKSKAPSN